MAKTESKNGTAAYDPRQIWATNLAPLMVAAREGAAHAARTASRERARARQQPAWWRQRWVIITTAGLAVVGAAGGVYAMLASRRSRGSRHAMPNGPGLDGSNAGTGRAKVTDLARNVVHKLRGSEPDQLTEAPPVPEPAEGGYHGQP